VQESDAQLERFLKFLKNLSVYGNRLYSGNLLYIQGNQASGGRICITEITSNILR
jgi:hypothetical protein